MTGAGQEVATVLEDVAKKTGPALANDFAGAYQGVLHETADGLEHTAGRVVNNEENVAKDFNSITEEGAGAPTPKAEPQPGGGKPGGTGEQPAASGGEPHGNSGQHAEGNDKTETGQTDPVDVVSGQVLVSADDVDLPGLLPLLLRRAYASGYLGGRLFGPGWSSTVDQRVEVADDGVRFFGDDAQTLHYPVPTSTGEQVYPADGAQWPLTWDRADDTIRITDPRSGWTRHFRTSGPANGAWPISALTDRNAHRIEYLRDAAGRPVEVRHSGGYRVAVDTTDLPAGVRVAALRLVGGGSVPGITLLRYGYDDLGRLVEIVDSSGVPYRYEYDSAARAARITAWVERNGGRYEYAYDEAGRAVRGTGPDGLLSSTLRFDPGRRLTTVTDSLGHTTEYHYDEHRHVVKIVDPVGNTTLTERDRYGQVRARIDALGNTTRYELDANGNPTRSLLADGTHATVEYNDFQQPVRVVGPDGAQWHYRYDERGNLATTTDPLGATTTYAYDQRGILTGFADALGNTTHVQADGHGLVMTVTDPAGGTLRYSRDVFGRIVEAVDAMGVTTRYGWTVEGLPAWREAPDGSRERWTYDPSGNTLAYQAAGGYQTTFTYTHFHLPTSRTTRDGRRYVFEYDTELRLVSVTDPQGLRWHYEYDAAGRLVAETDFNGSRASYLTDAAGDLVERVNGAGQRVRYVRDALGRVTERQVGEQTTTMAYDGAGRLIQAVGPDARVDFVRDALGRIVSESIDGRAVRNEFDALGRRTVRTTPTGCVSRWDYDAAGQPVTLATGAGSLRFGYDTAGRETTRLLGSAATLKQTWDRAGRLAGQAILAHLRPPSGPPAADDHALVQQRGYAYRADGIPLRIDDRLRGRREYTLDATGRVTAVQTANWTEQYAYDPTGNPAWAAASGPLMHGDSGGERAYTGTLVRRAGRTVYQHDGQGRVVRQTRRTLSGQQRTWVYTWNADDRLTDVTTPDGTRWHYRYDALGRRVAKQRLGPDGSPVEETLFAWDGTTLAEQTVQSADNPQETTKTWDYEPGSYRPAAQTDHTRPREQAEWDAAFYAIVTDLVGTPAELIDQDGNVAWATTTDLWGRDAGQADDGVDCPLRFPGQYRDEETGWHYNYSRYYDPATARYASPDPLGLEAAPNQHGYVDNPTSWSDPLGLYKTDDQMLADAKAIHGAIRTGRTEPGASIAYNGMTVATGEFDGRYVYTVNNNLTSPAMRQTADNLGYERVSGKKFKGPNQTDAEQIMLNAHDKGELPLSEGNVGRIAPSRPACGPRRQDCRGRIAGYPNITLIE